ncbi:MAG: ATP-binding protein [Pseudomonadota bacterium]
MERNSLREIALDQRRIFSKKPRGTKRDALDAFGRHIGKPHAVVISGVRRCGKSTLLLQIADKYFGDDYFYFNFEDDRLIGFTPRDFSLLHEVLIECFGEQKVFLLDEIQNAPGWEGFLHRMQEAGFKFVITGSNASLLSRELGTKLTGRHLGVELYPFSFIELARHCDVDVSERNLLTPAGRAGIAKLFARYRLHGGFPQYLAYNDPEILSQLYDDILYRDVAARHDIKNIRELKELAIYYMSNVSALSSFNRLKKAFGMGSVTTVSSYTEYLEQSYLISSVNVFDYSVKRKAIAPKKVYAIDTGLANIVSLSFSKNLGPLAENIVFLELMRRGLDVSYYKTQSGCEVDFACVAGRKIAGLIQVSHSISDKTTFERETRALFEAMQETGMRRATILTENEHEAIASKGMRIYVIPIAQWLLGM